MNSELENALIAWFNTFNLSQSTKIEAFGDLINGIAITEIMQKIYPKFFDCRHIVKEVDDNWSLIHKNLTYFYDGLSKFYFGVLYQPFDKNSVDILSISKEKDLSQLLRLVESLVGAIIQCDQKEIFINAILFLEEQYQTQLMHLIQKIIERTKIKEANEIRDVEKEKKLMIKLDEVENENAILISRLQESNEEKDKWKLKFEDLKLQCQGLEKQISDFNSKQEQFLSIAGIKDSEDYENIIKIRDEKCINLEHFIKELKLKHEQELSILRDDLELKKKKLLNVQKLENTLEYYKQKYEESIRVSERKNELEMQNESNLCKLEDYEKKIAFLHAKISKYKEKISIEKNKALNFEINHSKQIIELDSLRQEKLENETKIQKLECDLEDKNSQLEKIQLENHLKELQNNENHSLGNELSDMINNMETHHNLMKIERKGSISDRNETFNVQKELNEEQLELLEKENSLLIEKLKELQQTNEKMRLENLKNNALQQNSINTLLKEKEEMKEEINKLKIIAPSLANKELVAENKFLKEELEIYRTSAENSSQAEIDLGSKQKEELTHKNVLLEEIVALKKENEDLKFEFSKFKEDFNKESFQKQSNELFELQKEVKILRSLNNEEIENKDDELRLLVAILYDLRIKYQELEKGKIITKGVTKSNEINVPKKINRDSTPNIRKK